MVALVRSGRSANDLAKEFEPTAQTISAWVRQADRDEGRRDDGLTIALTMPCVKASLLPLNAS